VNDLETASRRARQLPTPPSAFAVLLGVLWWIFTLVIAVRDGPLSAVAWISIPYIVIASHQAGRWIAAWAARVPVSAAVVRIGVGPSVGVVTKRVRLGLLPGGGALVIDPIPKRWQRVAVGLGGAAGNLLLALALAIVASGMRDTPVWIGVTALASLATGVASLIPLGSRRVR
jgi:hypothetical protein